MIVEIASVSYMLVKRNSVDKSDLRQSDHVINHVTQTSKLWLLQVNV